MNETILTRKQLFELVWSEPMTSLAKRFDISDVGLRKICIKMKLPIPKSGYWQKIKFGKKVSIADLPFPEMKAEVKLQEINRTSARKEYPWTKRQIEIENDQSVNLTVPAKLKDPDQLVIRAKQILTSKENKSWKFDGMVGTSDGALNILVEPKLVNRALLFMDTFIKLLNARGHRIEIEYDTTYAIIHDYRVKIQVRERSTINKNPDSKDTWRSSEFIPTGRLLFKSDGYHRYEWQDGKKKLEEQLSSILAKIEIDVEWLQEIWRQNKIRDDEKKRLEQIKLDAEKRKRQELLEFKKLLNKALRWQQVKILRDFIDDAENRAISSNSLSEEFLGWMEWAKKKADWYDPHLESDDELLKDIVRETLS